MKNGKVKIWEPTDSGIRVLGATSNMTMHQWGAIAARCVGMGDPRYAIRGMYLEFENAANSSDDVTVPSYAAEDGVDYYTGLVGSPNRDYILAPLAGRPDVSVIGGTESSFPAGEGNKLTLFAQTSGTQGVHGKPFGHTNNSIVFGVAIVATPVGSDRTQDLIYARAYLPVEEQIEKSDNKQIGMTYEIEFPPAV